MNLHQVYAVCWCYATQVGCRVDCLEEEEMNRLVLVAEDNSKSVVGTVGVVSAHAAIAAIVVFALVLKKYGDNRRRSGSSAGLAEHCTSHRR